ncbi:hypothetical protein [Brevibacillus laterosporus]|uniref:Ribosomal protein L7/L12 C-terminal domain-containing protein n=1 Tax=Brevibacillus laterosporus TaxID=1465 RepID=A0AAP3GDP6_BRELA|nr:hypothetical protein [Brevibacillus laterosporus]MCR8981240.1 hypothetical protein [Brevibacillus laterosporus]MCZ0808394.1 hypothetical protein [Brevibacillus laterosporus]MCZ0826682.1 hypothetical protein [Brevibacillus laterosporus]MCZ0850495.1 hypothetical protein [Brevibacillus laterosporus]PPA93562.1 hypothetical protein C4A77_17945 [Brevibacillus laterosporus]
MDSVSIIIWTTTLFIVTLILFKNLYTSIKMTNIRLKEISQKLSIENQLDLEVRSLIERGEKAGAIKLVQDKLKLTTQEAKHYIELL